jgi:hypothetical protein
MPFNVDNDDFNVAELVEKLEYLVTHDIQMYTVEDASAPHKQALVSHEMSMELEENTSDEEYYCLANEQRVDLWSCERWTGPYLIIDPERY